MIGFDLIRGLLPRGGYKREVAESFVTNLAVTGLQVITGVLLARMLGPKGRGQLLAIQALPLIVGTFGMLGLQEALIYFGARAPKRIGNYAVSATALISLLGVPIVGASLLLTPWFLREQTAEVIHAGQIYLGLFFIHALTSLSTTTARAAHDISLWNRLRVVPPFLWLALILLLQATDRLEAITLTQAYLAVLFVWCWIAILPARRHYGESCALRPSLWPQMLRYGLPVAVGGTPRVLNTRIDQLIIAGIFAAEDLGLYGVAVSWSALMLLPGTAMIGVAFSKIAGMRDGTQQRSFARKALWTLAAISLLTAAALAAAAPIAIPLLFTAEFGGAVPVAIALCFGMVLRNVVQMAQNLMMGVGKPGVVMYSEWAGLATLLGLILFLTPRFGLNGVAAAVVAGNAVALSITLWLFARWSRSVSAPVNPEVKG